MNDIGTQLRDGVWRFKINKWTPPPNSGGIPYVSTRFSLGMKMSRLTRDGNVEPLSRYQIIRRERGQGNIVFPYSADHEQDWQPSYPIDPYSRYMCNHTRREISRGLRGQSGVARGRVSFVQYPPQLRLTHIRVLFFHRIGGLMGSNRRVRSVIEYKQSLY